MSRERFRAGKRLWNSEDDQAMRRLYPDTPNAQIAQRLRRTVHAIYARADKLQLHKSAAYQASPYACRLRRNGDEHPGRATQFPKGHVPANKGLRRPGWSRGRMKETQFKPGVPSGNTMPIGSTRLVEGYVYRKVSDVPKVSWTRNWKTEHVRVWEAAHGPVPTGHAVVFLNGDKRDIRLENLECITRRELMARNTVHNLPKPLAETIQLLGALNRKIRRRSNHAGEEQDRRSA